MLFGDCTGIHDRSSRKRLNAKLARDSDLSRASCSSKSHTCVPRRFGKWSTAHSAMMSRQDKSISLGVNGSGEGSRVTEAPKRNEDFGRRTAGSLSLAILVWSVGWNRSRCSHARHWAVCARVTQQPACKDFHFLQRALVASPRVSVPASCHHTVPSPPCGRRRGLTPWQSTSFQQCPMILRASLVSLS
jgi:hypothetical protein